MLVIWLGWRLGRWFVAFIGWQFPWLNTPAIANFKLSVWCDVIDFGVGKSSTQSTQEQVEHPCNLESDYYPTYTIPTYSHLFFKLYLHGVQKFRYFFSHKNAKWAFRIFQNPRHIHDSLRKRSKSLVSS